MLQVVACCDGGGVVTLTCRVPTCRSFFVVRLGQASWCIREWVENIENTGAHEASVYMWPSSFEALI